MKEERDVKILAIVGMSGSGKSVVIDHLVEKGYPKVYFGGMILRGMETQGIPVNEENERKFREEIREKEGKDWVVRQAIAAAKDLISAGQKRIVMDGVYSYEEYKILRHEFPGELTVLAVVVDKALRYKRVGKREVRPLNREEVSSRDVAEVENLEKGGPIAMADYYVLNNGTIAELHDAVDRVLKETQF